MKRPIHAVLFAIYPVLYVVAANPGQVTWPALLTTILAFAAVAATLLAVFRLPFKNWEKAALAVTVVTVFFYAYAPVHQAVSGSVGSGPLSKVLSHKKAEIVALKLHQWISLAWIALIAATLTLLARLRIQRLGNVTRALNGIALTLVAASTLQIAYQAVVAPPSTAQVPAAAPAAASGEGRPAALPAQRLPDVYYIILDGYARADVLAKYYGYDNSAFLDGLRKLGFSVNDSSFANYYWTFLSLSSSLNMDYVQELAPGEFRPGNRNRAAIYGLIKDNAVARFLRGKGYRYVHLPSTWGATLNNPHADEVVPCGEGLFSDEFHLVIAEISWLSALNSLASSDLARCYLNNLKNLSRMGAEPGPKFVFAHFLPPHHPYLFDRDGNVLRSANLSNQFEFQKQLWEEKAMYVSQLEYMSKRILGAVEGILASSPTPPIIVIQSDHGPNITRGLSRSEILRVRFANFAAFYTPGAPAGLIPKDTPPVNEFRRIFNHYFGAGLEILPARHFHSTYERPFSLQEMENLSTEPRPKKP